MSAAHGAFDAPSNELRQLQDPTVALWLKRRKIGPRPPWNGGSVAERMQAFYEIRTMAIIPDNGTI